MLSRSSQMSTVQSRIFPKRSHIPCTSLFESITTTMPHRLSALFVFLLLVGFTNGFVPMTNNRMTKTTKLSFGFLKELGLEKPSWLPDFGGAKAEDEPEPAAVDDAGDDDEEEEAVEE